MEQCSIFSTEKKAPVVAFTGHRTLGEDFYAEKLLIAIEKAVEKGARIFLCGMAVGFDLLAAEFVLSLKVENPEIQLIACIPCEGQDKYYSKEDKIRYHNVLTCVDKRVVLSEHYYKGCMQVRDKYMAEGADELICYCTNRASGTGYTLRCFERFHPDGKITFL